MSQAGKHIVGSGDAVPHKGADQVGAAAAMMLHDCAERHSLEV
jgi:hypothetical protein